MKALRCPLLLIAALAASSAFAANPAALWNQHCSKCHGVDGRGQTKEGRSRLISDLTDPAIQAKFTDKEAADSIKIGLKDAKGRTIMHGIRRVSEADADALVSYVRTLKK